MPQSVMAPFNNGLPLKVVRIPSNVQGEKDTFGVIDEENYRVWKERDLASTRIPNFRTLEEVSLPIFPTHYGDWKKTSIGGVSKTVRRVNIVRASSRVSGPVTIFSVRCPTERCIPDIFASEEDCSVGEPQYVDETHGIVTEVVIFKAEDLAHACALVYKAGGTVMLEDPSVNARRCLGVERLDRISAQVVCEENMYEENDGVYGLRRGNDNWKFPFLPDGWRVPITWDHMVENVLHEPLTSIPQPLRQHVAKRRLELGMYLKIGSRWIETVPVTTEELSEPTPPELRRILSNPSQDLVAWIRGGSQHVDEQLPAHIVDDITLKTIVQVDGVWYRPVDTTAFLKKQKTDAFGKRRVSAALKFSQSCQLLTAFYYLCIERRQTEDVNHAFVLIMYHYMKERGYTSRWMGKYDQFAIHIGNGDLFRNFNRLSVYKPHLLPVDVLNRLCGSDGKLKSRGSKGSRSKYKTDKTRYVPKRRLKRSRLDEEKMMETVDVSSASVP